MKKIAVILAGCGVYDGSEIHETVFSLLEIEKQRAIYQCFAPDKNQFHVVNHITGEPTEETRNVLVESARIARGEVLALSALNVSEFDALFIPGGFGAAKNLNQWAMLGPNGQIDAETRNAIVGFLDAKKPIGALCMGPTVVAKALEETDYVATLSVGTSQESSPYDIGGIHAGMLSIGAMVEEKNARQIAVDKNLKIVSAPCYMMDTTITEVHENVAEAVKAVLAFTR